MTDSKLPPFGFREGFHTMTSLQKDIRLLFRVEHKGAGSLLLDDDEDVYSLISTYASRRGTLGRVTCGKPSLEEAQDVLDHIWDTPKYITTYASLAYALRKCDTVTQWPSIKGNQIDLETVKLVIIDAQQVADHAYTLMECLTDVDLATDEHEHRLNLVKASQAVLVSDFVPRTAVVGILDWMTLVTELPKWFLNEGDPRTFITAPPPSSYGKRFTGGTIRGVFYAIRRRYAELKRFPSHEITRLQALRAAWSMLNRIDFDGDQRATGQRDGLLLTYLTYYLLTFPIAKWAPDTYHASDTIPQAAVNVDVEFSQQAKRNFNTFIKQKMRERQEMAALSSSLENRVFNISKLVSKEMRGKLRNDIAPEIRRIMEQVFHCSYKSTECLNEAALSIKPKLKGMQTHVENDDSGALVKEMARLEETLNHLDLMWTIHDGEEEEDDDDAMDIGNVDDEEEEPVVLPRKRKLPTTHLTASEISPCAKALKISRDARACRGVKAERDDDDAARSDRSKSTSSYATPNATPERASGARRRTPRTPQSSARSNA